MFCVCGMVGGMRNKSRDDKRTQHPKRVSYYPAKGSDGWRVELLMGERIMHRVAVDMKKEAIEGAKALLRDWPGLIFELAVVAEVWAWQEGGWFYTLKERPEATPARLLDDMGEEVMEAFSCGGKVVVRAGLPPFYVPGCMRGSGLKGPLRCWSGGDA